MSRSHDPDHFFQTSQSLAEATRKSKKSKNEKGQPIRLKSKISGLAIDPKRSDAVYVAESTGQVRRILPDTGESTHIYRGPSAPITSIALSSDGEILFAGCWDKTIWSWDAASLERRNRFVGHTDFVKAVTCARLPSSIAGAGTATEILISGSADSNIIVWDVRSGSKIHTLSGHNRGVLCLAIDPVSLIPPSTSLLLFSGCSDREIRQWLIAFSSLTPKTSQESSGNSNSVSTATSPSHSSRSTISSLEPPLTIHETSVNVLHFPTSPASSRLDIDATDPDSLDLWTASADTTAKSLTRPAPTSGSSGTVAAARDELISEGGWPAAKIHESTTLKHSPTNHLRALTTDLSSNLVFTAGRDETIRVWDMSSGEMQCTFDGHYDEITGLAVIEGYEGVNGSIHAQSGSSSGHTDTVPANSNGTRRGIRKFLVSVSLDGTLRRWSLAGADLASRRAEMEREEARRQNGEVDEGDECSEQEDYRLNGAKTLSNGEGTGMMTAEEEKELEDLMAEEDE